MLHRYIHCYLKCKFDSGAWPWQLGKIGLLEPLRLRPVLTPGTPHLWEEPCRLLRLGLRDADRGAIPPEPGLTSLITFSYSHLGLRNTRPSRPTVITACAPSPAVTALSTERSDNRKPPDSQRSTAAACRAQVDGHHSRPCFSRHLLVIPALPWMLMNKRLLSDNTDTNRSV